MTDENLEPKFGIECTPNESEGSQWYEVDCLEFIETVKEYPCATLCHDAETNTYTLFCEAWYGEYWR